MFEAVRNTRRRHDAVAFPFEQHLPRAKLRACQRAHYARQLRESLRPCELQDLSTTTQDNAPKTDFTRHVRRDGSFGLP
jgi:hypothetical protein